MLYRIVQQAMQNIVRHSRATAIRVSANITGDSVMLELRDNGQGFDRDQVPAGHFGLRSMQRRAEILGGTCSIASQPGQGTVVQLEVPVRQ
jgi:signal transduction histidine kinase